MCEVLPARKAHPNLGGQLFFTERQSRRYGATDLSYSCLQPFQRPNDNSMTLLWPAVDWGPRYPKTLLLIKDMPGGELPGAGPLLSLSSAALELSPNLLSWSLA